MHSSEISFQEATRLVALSREACWSFPSSMGRPVRWDSPGEWVERLVKEQGRFAEAANLLINRGHDAMALELASNVWRLWIFSRDIAGGRRFLAPVLELTKQARPSRARALALYGDGLFAFRQGRLDESRDRNEESLTIAMLVNDPEAQALSYLGLSRVDFENGDYEAALSTPLLHGRLPTISTRPWAKLPYSCTPSRTACSETTTRQQNSSSKASS